MSIYLMKHWCRILLPYLITMTTIPWNKYLYVNNRLGYYKKTPRQVIKSDDEEGDMNPRRCLCYVHTLHYDWQVITMYNTLLTQSNICHNKSTSMTRSPRSTYTWMIIHWKSYPRCRRCEWRLIGSCSIF